MNTSYDFMVNDSWDEDRPMPEIALQGADGQPVDVWHFFRGASYDGAPVPVTIESSSGEHHLLYDAFLVPFVSRRLAEAFRESAAGDVQLVPTMHPDYWILNVLRILDAIDRTNSVYSSYPADYPRADLAGKPMMFSKVVLSPDKVSGHVFRLVDWTMAIVVSGRVREHIIGAGIPGVVFSPVQVSGHL
jgi:hypothetical protein